MLDQLIARGFDAHMHLNETAFEEERDKRIDRLAALGYEGAVSGWDLASSKTALELALRHPNLHAVVGFHPCYLPRNLSDALSALCDLAGSGAVAIGECGLDETSCAEELFQREALHAQLDLACQLSLPAVLHVRGKHGALLDVLHSRRQNPPLLLHGASLSRELLREYLALGCRISLGGLAARSGAKKARETAKAVPDDLLLIETDCPYQPPVPGTQSGPEDLFVVARAIAELRGTDEQSVLDRTRENAYRFFGLMTEGCE